MNPIQNQSLGLGAAVILAMLIFPPWTKITHHVVRETDRNLSIAETETQESAGYSLLFKPPPTRGLANPQMLVPGDSYEGVEIDFGRLVVQWLAAAFLTGVGLLYFKESDKKSLLEWWLELTPTKPSPPSNPPKPPPPDSPISKTQVATNADSSKVSEPTPQNQLSPWKRAGKAFGFGFFVGVASTYSGKVDISPSERMLCAGIIGVIVGLVSYLVAVGYYASGGPVPVENHSPPLNPPKPPASKSPPSILAIFCLMLSIVFGLLTIIAFANSKFGGGLLGCFLTLCSIQAYRGK